jgi:hypothetical protein
MKLTQQIKDLQSLLSHHYNEIKRLKASREEYAQENIQFLCKESDQFKAKLDRLFNEQ